MLDYFARVYYGITVIYGQVELIVLPCFMALFCAFVLLEQNYAQNSIVKMANLRFPPYWGTYNYGLYYLALLAGIQLLRKLKLNTTVLNIVVGDNLVELTLAFLISWVSFNFYENPFLKNRFAFITHE